MILDNYAIEFLANDELISAMVILERQPSSLSNSRTLNAIRDELDRREQESFSLDFDSLEDDWIDDFSF